jgi:hypothetical protein
MRGLSAYSDKGRSLNAPSAFARFNQPRQTNWLTAAFNHPIQRGKWVFVVLNEKRRVLEPYDQRGESSTIALLLLMAPTIQDRCFFAPFFVALAVFCALRTAALPLPTLMIRVKRASQISVDQNVDVRLAPEDKDEKICAAGFDSDLHFRRGSDIRQRRFKIHADEVDINISTEMLSVVSGGNVQMDVPAEDGSTRTFNTNGSICSSDASTEVFGRQR